MIAALIAAGWCVTPVLAEPRVTVHHDASPHDGWFARLEVLNLFGVYNQVEVLETTHGPVSIEYATSLPHALNDPASADTACVVDLPDGVVALPPCVNVLERETGTIFLHDFLGG